MKFEDFDEQAKRKLLFTPQGSKHGLQMWLRRFLGIDLPSTIVLEDETNSTPLDLVWEIYDAARRGDDPDFTAMLGYAARESMKTLATAILEVLCVLHLGRDVVHLAAIEQQSKKAQSYVKKFFMRPLLRAYVILDNDRKKEICHYVHGETGEVVTPAEYATKSPGDALGYEQRRREIVIVVATMQSVNGQHSSFVCCDELDVMQNPEIYEEAKLIPTPTEDDKPAITFLTSTRKFAFGIVQKEIDDAETTGLKVRHWTIIDVTKRCPPSRHEPDAPKVDAYVDDANLVAIGREKYVGLAPELREKFKQREAFAGCLKNCKLFAACQGKLATKQIEHDPKSPARSMLKSIDHVQSQFRRASVEKANAQLLCRKPTTIGLVYPGIDPDVHVIAARQIAEMIAGTTVPEVVGRASLVDWLKKRGGLRWRAGMDFGYTHIWAIAVAVLDGPRCFVLGAVGAAELETQQQIQIAKGRFGDLPGLKIYADPEDPEAIKQYKKHFKCVPVDKPAGSVVSGIEMVRARLRPALGAQPTLYFLKDEADPGVSTLVKRLQLHHWKLDAAGRPTDVPSDDGKDFPDALRYLIYGSYGKQGKLEPGTDSAPPPPSSTGSGVYGQDTWMAQVVSELLGTPNPVTGSVEPSTPAGPVKGKRGGFFFDLA